MLDSKQIAKLNEYCQKWIAELVVTNSDLQSGETNFTSNVLMPWLGEKVLSLQHPGLYVRGDGGPSVRPLLWSGISFFPDMAIVEGETTHIAFEIKILGNNDPSGSLTKAIGQTALYSNLGYANSYGLIFEQRFVFKDDHQLLKTNEVISGENFHISYYS